MPPELDPLTVNFHEARAYVMFRSAPYYIEWTELQLMYPKTLFADVLAPEGQPPRAIALYKDPKHTQYAGVGRREYP